MPSTPQHTTRPTTADSSLAHGAPGGEKATRPAQGDARLGRLLEAFDQLWDTFVDPTDALYDEEGARWTQLGVDGLPGRTPAAPFGDESQLAGIRAQCRALAVANEFAINGHENRISYIVGAGHQYRAVARRDQAPASELVEAVQTLLDDFLRENRWHQRQREIVHRKDRDGECFLRLFAVPDGTTRVRFVEPGQVATPPTRAADRAASFGIQTDPDDVETVLGYWIDGRLVDAAEIQHRKLGVDANVKRGLPLFYPVRKNLRRAERLLRNMSVVAEIQSAIALIRKHVSATGAGLEQFVQDQADLSVADQTGGRTSHFRRYGPGTILDAAAGTQYEFPAAGLDAAAYVAVLQAELRAIASRLVMPEFMLTSDASNANYASTMVAEGPAVKMFERLQQEMIGEDREVLWRVVENAVGAGRLPPESLGSVEIQATAPTLAVRDRLRDAQADQILLRNGAMSPETMALRHGLRLPPAS
ncbi:MAG: phage portal protein [Pirellulales bacterium]|nr:phage portal protein [Pirellulales bacterium]